MLLCNAPLQLTHYCRHLHAMCASQWAALQARLADGSPVQLSALGLGPLDCIHMLLLAAEAGPAVLGTLPELLGSLLSQLPQVR